MKLDIDHIGSVNELVNEITSDWIDVYKMYHDLKSDSETDWSSFWSHRNVMLQIISNYAGLRSDQFIKIWIDKCIKNDLKIMGYHSTRHSDKDVFYRYGILPLSEKTVELSKNKQDAKAKQDWKYRSGLGAGPYFFLSNNTAKNPKNPYFEGPEILSSVDGNQPSVNLDKSIPLLLHCEIPYSIIPDKTPIIGYTIMIYINSIDPDDSIEALFEKAHIDLKGNSLSPQHITKIEEIEVL